MTRPDSAHTPAIVREIAVPPAARALSTLSQVDYADAFLVEDGPTQDRTPEQWVRAIGMPAELLLQRQRHTLLFDTFVRHENRIARGMGGDRAGAPAGRAVRPRARGGASG